VYHAAISDYDAVGLDYMLARRLRRATSCLERVALGGATTAMQDDVHQPNQHERDTDARAEPRVRWSVLRPVVHDDANEDDYKSKNSSGAHSHLRGREEVKLKDSSWRGPRASLELT
jgi:hypothetical protein